MKKNDFTLIIIIIILILPFFVFEDVFLFVKTQNQNHGMIFSFIKFAILATLGESIGLRIRTGEYNNKNFGIIPRAIVWGFLGLAIKMSFVIFAKGTPVFLQYMGIENSIEAISGAFTFKKLFVAFSISTALNLIFAPVMMTIHKITDIHIESGSGSLKKFFKPIIVSKIIQKIDWKTHWNFVIKKTIPIFWIPAHTITFLLPEEVQILFAALLGVALGIILSIANLKNTK